MRAVMDLLEMIQGFMHMNMPILQTIRVADLLDIAILSFLIYRLIWMLRKSSSGRV